MNGECLNDCVLPDPFPRRPDNRPSLPRIGYRIGAYADFRAHLLRSLNLDPILQPWTHRQADDPGIALLEGAAIVGDILTFYQDLYANEAFLRTAQWRTSVAQLVRLLGYRLRPGLAGSGRFAFEVKGTSPVTVAAGFPLKAELAGGSGPVDFATTGDLTAYPGLSRFRLYRPRRYASSLPAGSTQLELASVGGATDAPSLAAAGLKKGDKLLLVPDDSMWSVSGTAFSEQQAFQIVTVSAVTTAVGRVLLQIDGSLADAWVAPVTAYRLGRTFHHFGNNAPPRTVLNNTDSNGNITGSFQYDTSFDRHLCHTCYNTDASLPLPATLMPLDQEVNDLSVGGTLILSGLTARDRGQTAGATQDRFAQVRTIAALRGSQLGFGNLNGASTFVELDAPLLAVNAPWATVDIRELRVHEALGPALTLQPPAAFDSGAFANTHKTLCFYGTQAEVVALAGRPLLLQRDADDTIVELTCTDAATAFDPGVSRDTINPWMWDLEFDQLPAPLALADFDEAAPAVTVFGNLADADQGKAESTAVLGNGDGRQTFQTFKLPKAPLAFHTSASATPPEVPDLTVRVGGREWSRVESFFGRGPLEEIFVVRNDDSDASYVQFGDGITGARLPSGLQNVTADYRTGNGAHGALKSDSKVQAGARLSGLDKIQLPGVVAGGADPEPADRARTAAPAQVQSLGRLVSLADYESETLGIAGVTRAAAAWQVYDGVPSAVLTVLLAAGRAQEFDAVRSKIAEYQRCRGPNRFPVIVLPGALRFVYLDLTYAFDPTRQRADIEAAIALALGLAPDATTTPRGRFALGDRQFGEPEYATRIEGTVQNVSGVLWCEVTALGLLAPGDDPSTLTSPADPKPFAALLTCGDAELLQLDATHLTLTAAPAPPTDPCADA